MAIPWQVYPHLPRRIPLEDRHSRYCLNFDNTVFNRITGPVTPTLDGQTFSIRFWVKLTQYGGSHSLFSKHDAAGANRSLLLRIYNDSRFLFSFFGDDLLIGGAPFAAHWGVWTHLVFTFNSVTRRREIYLNGLFLGGDISTNQLQLTDDNIWEIGRRGLANSEPVNGLIDEVSLTYTAWTAQEVLADFQQRGYAKRYASPRLNLRLEEGAGLAVSDDSGQGNNGTLGPVGTPPTWQQNQQWELLVEAGL